MNRSENYYQLPYSKVTVSKVTSCSVNRKDKLALSETVTDHSRLSASRSERNTLRFVHNGLAWCGCVVVVRSFPVRLLQVAFLGGQRLELVRLDWKNLCEA